MIDFIVFMTRSHITVFHTENKHKQAHKISNQLLSTPTPSTIFVITSLRNNNNHGILS